MSGPGAPSIKPSASAGPELDRSATTLMLCSAATALSVGAVVYQQGMTQAIALDLGVPASQLWSLSVATQLGYGLGLLFLLPVGDLFNPRRLIPGLLAALALMLAAMALSTHLGMLALLSFLAGGLSVGGQVLIAHAAKVMPAQDRLRVVGQLLGAVFAGLVLARALAGLLSSAWGWRNVYLLAAVATLTMALLLRGRVWAAAPAAAPTQPPLRYRAMLAAQRQLWAQTPALRRLALVAACFFAASTGLWASLASLLTRQWRWSLAEVGVFALLSGAALLAPRLATQLTRERSWTSATRGLGAWLMGGASVAALWAAWPHPAAAQAWGTGGVAVALALATLLVGCEIVTRSVHVLAQGQALQLGPAMAARINSLFMTVFFIGGALGAWLGGLAASAAGWPGLLAFPAVCAALGLLALPRQTRPMPAAPIHTTSQTRQEHDGRT